MRPHLLIAFVLLLPTLLLSAMVGAQTITAKPGSEPTPAGDEAVAATVVNPRVALVTSLGEIEIELDANHAPKTVANFLSYVADGHYNGTVFHRVVADMLIQGGGFTPDLQHKPTRAPVASEANNGLSNTRGTVVAARMPGDANSATAQFFINAVDNPDFDFSSDASDYTRGYTVFGRVVHGLDVVDRIRSVEVSAQGPFASGVPKTPVIIEWVKRIVEPAAPAPTTPAPITPAPITPTPITP